MGTFGHGRWGTGTVLASVCPGHFPLNSLGGPLCLEQFPGRHALVAIQLYSREDHCISRLSVSSVFPSWPLSNCLQMPESPWGSQPCLLRFQRSPGLQLVSFLSCGWRLGGWMTLQDLCTLSASLCLSAGFSIPQSCLPISWFIFFLLKYMYLPIAS